MPATKPTAFKARARKLLRAAAPYCVTGSNFDRRVRDAADYVRDGLDRGRHHTSMGVLCDELGRALANAAPLA